MRGRRLQLLVALPAVLVMAGPRAAHAAGAPTATHVVPLGGDFEALVPDGDDVRALSQQRPASGTIVQSSRLGATGQLEPTTSLLTLPALADLEAVKSLPGGGTLSVFNTRGNGYDGNELRAVVDAGAMHIDQRLNPPSTQASELFWDSTAVGPTGAIVVPYLETALPYGVEKYYNYALAVRPAGAGAFLPAEPIFPRGDYGYDLWRGRTFLGPDGGGWVFLLPDGDDWRPGQPVVVLARRIEPDGRLGVLLRLRVPIRRPINISAEMAAAFDPAGRLVATFSASGYAPPHDEERAVVWTQTFDASTATPPPRSFVVDRKGGYDEQDNIDLQLDAEGRATVLTQTNAGLRLFAQRGAHWKSGPLLTSRATYSSRLVRLGDGRTVAVWLQPYNSRQDRSNLMLATGSPNASRWPAHRVRGLGKPGLIRLDAVTPFGQDRLAAAIYARDERIVLTQIGR